MTVEPCEVVSGDRDLMALATERVTILYTGRGVAKLEVLGPDEIMARFGVPAARYADFAVLRGDASDGLPGVSGIGAKTAAALVVRFGTVEAIVEAAHNRSSRLPGRRGGESTGGGGLPACRARCRPWPDGCSDRRDRRRRSP